MSFGKRLKLAISQKIIDGKPMSQGAFAKLCGMERTSLTRMLNDERPSPNPSEIVVSTAVEVLGVRRAWLVRGEEPMRDALLPPRPLRDARGFRAALDAASEISPGISAETWARIGATEIPECPPLDGTFLAGMARSLEDATARARARK